MPKEIKCNNCNGSGMISLREEERGIEGIRGKTKCCECNGTGIVAYIKDDSDINFGSIEEAIKDLNDIVQEVLEFKNNGYEMNRDEVKLLKIVLRELERVSKENTTLKIFTSDIFNEDVTKEFIRKDKIREVLSKIDEEASKIQKMFDELFCCECKTNAEKAKLSEYCTVLQEVWTIKGWVEVLLEGEQL